jgi:hypothetical protein
MEYILPWLKNLKVRDYSEDLGIDGRIKLEWILGKLGGHIWTARIWVSIRTIGGLL